jgi:hypothetical protein
VRYNFSAEFLRVLPPDTSFGEAWESLCYDLLLADNNDYSLQRLRHPDKGIDIWHKRKGLAYQCKSDQRGALGSLSAADSIDSLRTAVTARRTLSWTNYAYATNANYSGSAVAKILEEGEALQVTRSEIEFHGPNYWSDLCERHYDKVAERLDYRICVTAEQVLEAFRKASYYDQLVSNAKKSMAESPLVLKIKNNLTPVELQIPFSPELGVENCVRVVQELLGISLKWVNHADLGTSSGPSISLTINRRGQTFSQTIGELEKKRGSADLEFWITVVWSDKPKDDGEDVQNLFRRTYLCLDHPPLTLDATLLTPANYADRQRMTLDRSRGLIQAMVWNAAANLKRQQVSPAVSNRNYVG